MNVQQIPIFAARFEIRSGKRTEKVIDFSEFFRRRKTPAASSDPGAGEGDLRGKMDYPMAE